MFTESCVTNFCNLMNLRFNATHTKRFYLFLNAYFIFASPELFIVYHISFVKNFKVRWLFGYFLLSRMIFIFFLKKLITSHIFLVKIIKVHQPGNTWYMISCNDQHIIWNGDNFCHHKKPLHINFILESNETESIAK